MAQPRAYILDSLRHPEEVNLLRRVYSRAFVLVGVVCEEERRITRISEKYGTPDLKETEAFMVRDADDDEKYGQHVADAFHLADYFLDNTADRGDVRTSNPSWDVVENLSRLVKIVTHAELVRPTVAETAMYHAFSAQMQSACLSRQVGAAVVDSNGNVLATGTNEVPKAGGGVYGESFEKESRDSRCAFFKDPADRYCRNTRSQNKIIEELIASFKSQFKDKPDVQNSLTERSSTISSVFRKTPVGGLLEFSRCSRRNGRPLVCRSEGSPPSNYQWNQYNKNVNVNVNNNYYGKFNSNTVNTRNPNVNNINANNRPAVGAGNRPNNWKGQSTYQGARPSTARQSSGSSMANANPANRANAGNNAAVRNRPTAGNNAAAGNRPNGGNNAATNRPNFASNPGANNMDRPNTANSAATNRPGAANPGTMNRTAAPSSMNRGGDRGYSSAAARPNGGSAQAARPAPQAQNRGGGSNSAFGSGGSANSERTASSRGQASMRGGGSRGRGH